MRYSIQPMDRIYVKGYGFLSFGKNLGNNLSSKYGQKLLDSAKKSTIDAIKTASKREIQNSRSNGDFTGNKIADKVTSVSKKFSVELCSKLHSQNNKTNDELETPKERYISLEKRQQIIDELRLV